MSSPKISPHARERLVAGDDHRRALVAAGDEHEHQARGLGVERDVADLVADQQRDPLQPVELRVELALTLRIGQHGDPFGRGAKQHALAGEARADPQGDAEMCLAGPGRVVRRTTHVVEFLPARVRLIAAPGRLRDVVLEVLGWSTDRWSGETVLLCRLLDGSAGEIPARWTDLPWREPPVAAVGGLGSPGGVAVVVGARGAAAASAAAASLRSKTEVIVSGQLALAVEETVVPAAVWETLPAERQREVAIRLARLLARIVEAARDE